MNSAILIDAREFVNSRYTGIARVLEGLVGSLASTDFSDVVILAVYDSDFIPQQLRKSLKVKPSLLPNSFFKSELALTELTRTGIGLFISPYPKLPLFGCHCKAVHIVHDVLDLTHPAYRRRFRVFFDTWRLKRALKTADLTWYDSSWSMEETRTHTGFVGTSPKVRYLGISDGFTPDRSAQEQQVLMSHGLTSGYILAIGNGLPHKNLGVLLSTAHQISRSMVFVGAQARNRSYWTQRYPQAKAVWIERAADEHLPILIRGAFCLAQPSTAEGYGYPPLEAMACGVPAVVSSIPVLIETTGGNALTADPYDSRGWLQALKALEDRHLYQEMVGKGLRWARPLQGANAWRGHISDVEDLLKVV